MTLRSIALTLNNADSSEWAHFNRRNFVICSRLLVTVHAPGLNKRLIGMCRELYNHREWLWTFIEVHSIEPTNNTAERALRPAVIDRKLSFGTQSETGSRFIERMLTVSETCRLQKRSVFQWLIAAVEVSLHNRPAPSLVTDP